MGSRLASIRPVNSLRFTLGFIGTMKNNEITLHAFASARDDLGFTSISLAVDPSETPMTILRRVAPTAKTDYLRVALDCEFTSWDTPVGGARELAFLPPVSGG